MMPPYGPVRTSLGRLRPRGPRRGRLSWQSVRPSEFAMQINVYQTVTITSTRGLTNLDGILDKAAASAEARKFDPAILLNARLAPDMFTFTRQVQIAAEFAQ